MDLLKNDEVYIEQLIKLRNDSMSIFYGLRLISGDDSRMFNLVQLVDKLLIDQYSRLSLIFHRSSGPELDAVIREYRRTGKEKANYNDAVSKGKERRDQVDVMRSNKYRYFNY